MALFFLKATIEIAHAGFSITEIATNQDSPSHPLLGSLELSLNYGVYSASIPGLKSVEDHLPSFQTNLDLHLNHWWIESSYERLETKLATLGHLQSIFGFNTSIGGNWTLSSGIGCGFPTTRIDIAGKNLNLTGSEFNFLVGLGWLSDPFFAKIGYTHVIRRNLRAEYDTIRERIHEDHIGTSKAAFGVRLNHKTEIEFALENQLRSNTIIEKKLITKIGIVYEF